MRPRTAIGLAVLTVALGGRSAGAQEGAETKPAKEIPVQPSPKVGASKSAPPVPANPAAREVLRALDDAKEELDAAEAEYAKEAEEEGRSIAALTKEVASLRDDQKKLDAELRRLDGELQETDKKAVAASESRTAAEQGMSVCAGELESQVASFQERFQGSTVATEDPDLLTTIAALKQGTREDLPERIRKLLGAYERVLDSGRTVSVFPGRIQMNARGGKLDRADILRLGLLGAYYLASDGAEAGFVLADADGGAGLKGESRGLSSGEQAQIASAVKHVESGGFLPLDITGGAGIAALQTQESWSRWFELGGFAMWPLLFVCLSAIILALERTASLAVKSIGIRRRTEKVLSLVRSGRAEDAEDLCLTMGGAVGGVLHAALIHRGKGRATMEEAVQEALLHHAPSFQTRLGFIALCAAVAPLLGLFGTVTGMIQTFKMVTLFGTSDPRFLAGGISEALITTEAGLMIAIPSLLVRGLLGSVADVALGKLETGALSLVIELSKQEETLVGLKGGV